MYRDPPVNRLPLLILALFIGLACHSSDASAPRTPEGERTLSKTREESVDDDTARPRSTDENGATLDPVVCRRRDPIVASAVFGPAGGTLIVGASRLIIPGGALLKSVTITATVIGDTTSTIHFAPSGLTFRKPAGLALSSAACTIPDDGSAMVVYLGSRGEILESIPAIYYPRFKTVAAPIAHFSGYAIAFREE